MRFPVTYKLRSAVEVARFLPNGQRTEYPEDTTQRDMLYAWLAQNDYIWSTAEQRWRKRKPGTRGPSKRAIVKENSFVLVRIMAKREILDNDRENFALAFEAIGYDVVSISEPIENRENGFCRIYIKAKVG